MTPPSSKSPKRSTKKAAPSPLPSLAYPGLDPLLTQWLQSKNWQPFDFQLAAWKAFSEGKSGLVNAPTGMGKSYSVWLAAVSQWLATGSREAPLSRTRKRASLPLRVLWITPMRALASDTAVALSRPIEELGLPWTIETRSGDTSTSQRKKQKEELPTTLVTTPESLSLLLSYPEMQKQFESLVCVVVDEWHELLGTKRGTQTELGLARLRKWSPNLQTWGLSATLGNIEQARDILLATHPQNPDRPAGELVTSSHRKQIQIETIIPENMERFPWAGHLGLNLLPQVRQKIANSATTLLFTNTRSQAEMWHQALAIAAPELAGKLGLHHGSVDAESRRTIEQLLRQGDLKCVVCTSSLDLGVDFSPVQQVIQVGSPKGIGRLLQRAGRAGHQPGAISNIVCVPTHAVELVEYSAARQAASQLQIESRTPLEKPLDLLAQHLVTIACGDPFEPQELYDEVRTSYSYRHLSQDEWEWTLDFVARGGVALRAYPQYRKLEQTDNRFHTSSKEIERWHRMAIGTISSDVGMAVRFMSGGHLGTIEESFIAKLKPHETFLFAGRVLELVIVRDMTAYVRKSKKKPQHIPRWDGGKLPLSVELSAAMRKRFSEAADSQYDDAEMQAVRPILELQGNWSALPGPKQLLIETCTVQQNHHTFIYPWEGRLVHEGLGALLAYRISQLTPCSITSTVNDYGFELLSNAPLLFTTPQWRELLSTENLLEDLYACLNATELAKRQFREIARVAGLIIMGYPGSGRTTKQLQASSGLLFDVFNEYDSSNLLLNQSRQEVLEQQLSSSRLSASLKSLAQCEIVQTYPRRLTPLAFPLWAARIQATHVTSEKWGDRVRKMVVFLEEEAGKSN